jgi:hypothetical protein
MSEKSIGQQVTIPTGKPVGVPVVILIKDDLATIVAPGRVTIRRAMEEEVVWYAAGRHAAITVRFDKGDGTPFSGPDFVIDRAGTSSGTAQVDEGTYRYSVEAILHDGTRIVLDPEVEVDGGGRYQPE